MTRLMYDTTDVPATGIPLDAEIVAGYIDGHYRSFDAVVARCPNAVHVPIAVFPSTNGGQVLDCETGDATPAQVPGWIQMRRAAGLYRPTVYTLASWAEDVKARCAAAGLVQNRDWDLWTAHYDGRPVPDGYGEVAKQYVNHGPHGENVDVSAVFDDAWPHVAPSPPPTTRDDQEVEMVIIEPAAARKAMGLPEEVCVGVPPAFSGGAGWGAVWGSLAVDNFGGPPTDVRVMVKDPTPDPAGWYPPAGLDGDTVHLQSGRSYGWAFKKGDQCVSLINRGIHTVSFLLETAPR